MSSIYLRGLASPTPGDLVSRLSSNALALAEQTIAQLSEMTPAEYRTPAQAESLGYWRGVRDSMEHLREALEMVDAHRDGRELSQ